MFQLVPDSGGAAALHGVLEHPLARLLTATPGNDGDVASLLAARNTASEGDSPPARIETGPDASDDVLVEAVLAGDELAFADLVARHSRRVMTIARHFFRQPDTAEDIAQETFAKAYLSLRSYRRGASFAHWLAKIAVNNCYDELRRRRKRNESLLSEVSETAAVWLETALAPRSFEKSSRDEDRSAAAELAELLLEHLEPEDRLVLVLLHAEELSVREIASITGWSEAKVKIRAFRARQSARRCLARIMRRR
ncbi:MAG: RNA polymerase sigma factor [Acidobacteria bacterium]|nr:RNA polymerase sigma factor [Acidobacteriota bacterium]